MRQKQTGKADRYARQEADIQTPDKERPAADRTMAAVGAEAAGDRGPAAGPRLHRVPGAEAGTV